MLYNYILRLLMYCVIIAREKQVISYDHMSGPKLSQTFSFDMSVGKDNKQTLKPCPTDDMLLTPLLVSPPPPPLDGRRLLPLTPTTLLPISTSSRTLPGLCSCRSCFERYLFFWIGFGGNLCFLTSQYSVVALADGGKFRYFFHCF